MSRNPRPLTEAQIRALRAMPLYVTYWGGNPVTHLPPGVRSVATIDALVRQDLVVFARCKYPIYQYSLTEKGRAALADLEGEPR
jgi:hypothetical protein